MRRALAPLLLASLAALSLLAACRPRNATPDPQAATYPQQNGYYPARTNPGYYYPPPPPGYYYPQQPPPGYYYPPPQGSAPPPGPSYTPPAAPTGAPPAAPAIHPRALELANAINRYRAQNGLPAIPISKSLSLVADAHVKDLADARLAPNCNAHSWTARGSWTGCCYTADHAFAKCMWSKPSELTPMKSTGFEIAIGEPGVSTGSALDAPKAIAIWQGSSLHNDVILNRGTWTTMTWRAMGAAIIDSHASAWFSDQPDPVFP